MQPTTLKELEWIHDCTLITVVYDASNDTSQSIKLTMRCPHDLGYSPWQGKTIQLVAVDVALVKYLVFGVAGAETIDAVRSGISKEAQESTLEARRMGVRFPSMECTICFHSGSVLEVICQELQVDVKL